MGALDPCRQPIGEEWSVVEEIPALVFDTMIRGADWHFMWLQESVLLTFGLLSPHKGIENLLRALPAILARHTDVVYIVSGVTYPHIRRREGERYSEQLQARAEQLGVSSHLVLNNQFVSSEELVEYVSAADIYITPYRQEAQVVSAGISYRAAHPRSAEPSNRCAECGGSTEHRKCAGSQLGTVLAPDRA